jgi:SAM-dependent MidA family methyltransferase
MSLKDDIITRIRSDGPMRIDEYMSTCLLHPTKGYYTTRSPFGAQGDFTTAPEISQMFGELVGLSLAQSWLDQGSPAPFTLAELGPGRGTLMADILRATKGVPGFADAMDIVLVEASPALRAVQRETLGGDIVAFVDTTDALPEQPLFLIANEFFDALPIRQFVRDGAQWRERQVGLDGNALCLGLGPALPQPGLRDRIEDTKDGDLIETATGFAATLAPVVDRIHRLGGTGLIIDYGDWRTLGDTLQAVQNHQSVDVLAAPGHSDLTAHVDFEALCQAAAPCAYSRVTPQGVFLERLGIADRARKLATTLSGAARDSHIAAHRRLTHPQEMGNLFKVTGLYPANALPPPGLEP